MTTLSVPIPAHMEAFIESQIRNGRAANKADVVRKAIALLAEKEAVDEVLRAMEEPILRGDLKSLAKRLRAV